MFRALVPLWPFVRPQFARAIAAEAAGLAVALADAGLIALLAGFLEPAPAGRDPRLYAAAVLLVATRMATARAQGAWHAVAAARVRAQLYTALHERLLRLPLPALRAHAPGDLQARVFHDAPVAASFALEAAPQAVLQALRTGLLLLVAALFHPATAGLTLAAALPLLWVARAFGRRSAVLHAELAESQAALYQAVEDALGAPEALRAYGAGAAERRRFDALAASVADREMRVARALAAAEPTATGIAGLLVLALVFQGQADVAAGRLTIGALAAAVAAAGAALAAARSLIGLHSLAQGGLVAAARVGALLEARLEPLEGSPAPVSFSRELAFAQVGFGYPGRGATLANVSFRIGRGERVALVGETGGGKTTLLRLLLRLEAPTTGGLTLDGVDAATLPLRAWRALFGLVPQDAQLLARSIENNVRFGREAVRSADVTAALEAAGLGDLVSRLARGATTEVGPAGQALSGGERLEVALARALVGQPEILVLDEATAGLDAISEQRALAAVRRGSEGRTLLLVTHRLSTARLADRVLVLEAGRIVEEGTFDELIAAGGALRRMWEAQGRPSA